VIVLKKNNLYETSRSSTVSPDTVSSNTAPSNTVSPEELQEITNVNGVTASCEYINLFSTKKECKSYTGSAWDLTKVEDDCLGEQEAVFQPDTVCEYQEILGTCDIDSNPLTAYQITFLGDDVESCGTFEQGCVLFANGNFTPSTLCEDVTGDIESTGIGSGGSVFQPI
jgi:hypothetical protein